jgi:uncharacterized protein YkwD
LVLAAITAVFVSAFAVPAMAASAGQFISKINSSRAAAGLAPLESYWDLTDDARSHSNLMAERGEIFHSSNLGSVTSVWENLGENVGVGIDVDGLHTAFMNSSAHKGNILGNYNYVGVGVTETADGFIWVTVIFMKAAPGLNGGGTATTTTGAPTPTTTVPPAPTSPPATQPVPVPVKAASGNVPSSSQEFGDAVFTDDLSMLEQLKLDYPTFGKPLPPAMVI